VTGSDDCIDCAAGRSTEVVGSESANDCIECNALEFALAGSSICASCPDSSVSPPGATSLDGCVCSDVGEHRYSFNMTDDDDGGATAQGQCITCPQRAFSRACVSAYVKRVLFPQWHAVLTHTFVLCRLTLCQRRVPNWHRRKRLRCLRGGILHCWLNVPTMPRVAAATHPRGSRGASGSFGCCERLVDGVGGKDRQQASGRGDPQRH
jgi:hypothetical protein